VDSCTFEANTADQANGVGGAIFNSTASNLSVVNSTFTNNRAARGGAVLNDGSTTEFYNSTIASNKGGGIALGRAAFSFADATLKNTIVAGNTGGNCGASSPTNKWRDLGGNVSSDSTCPGLVADPKLSFLATNGGPTETMALRIGSPAIDHAVDCIGRNAKPLITDQRGYPRPQGSGCDSGAYEKALLLRWPN
jgi:hypothetical protein